MNGYFDHNATTPLSPAAREAWLEAAERWWHNPSSLYREAGAARRLLEEAREELAERLGAEPERLVFVSGATEGNHAVLRHVARTKTGVALVSAVEHPSVREPAAREFGRERVVELPVREETGAVSPDGARETLASCGELALVSLMAANNETGALQPWEEVAVLCQERGVDFHCDASQWIGKLPAGELGRLCGYLTGCAHKFAGPKGAGFLLVPESETGRFRSLAGGPQESGRRAGTEDLPGILSMLAALRERSDAWLAENSADWGAARDGFERGLARRLPGIQVVAGGGARLWNTVMLVMPAHANLKWLTRLSDRGFAVSTGSACSAGKGNPSAVMAAMGLDHGEMSRVLRFSGGWDTATEDWEALAAALEETAADLAEGRRFSRADPLDPRRP